MGPLLFTLYTADISTVVDDHGLQLHQYADDCQVYVSAPVDEASATISLLPRLSLCVTDVTRWLNASRLRLNPAKTVLIWLGARQQVKIVEHEVPILSSSVTTVDTARDLGVTMDVISLCQLLPCVAQHTASCASYVKSCDRCLLMRPRQ